MSRILSFLLLSAFGGSADASLAALKGVYMAASIKEFNSYCEPKVSCSLKNADSGPADFGPEELSPAECIGKLVAAGTQSTAGAYKTVSFNPKPSTFTASGTQGVVVQGTTMCEQNGDGSCVPGTTVSVDFKIVYEFDDQDKVTSISVSVDDVAASLILSASQSVARRHTMTGILITTFLVSALSITCYQLGKKHGQANTSGGYTSEFDA